MKTDIFNSISRSIHQFGFKLKQHSPEIMVVGGVIGMVGTVVLACKATTKVHDITDKTKEKIDIIHKGAEAGEVIGKTENGEEGVVSYSQEDAKKDLTITYAHAALELAKLYGPAILLGTLSVTSILAGHHILRTRNLALAAAYTTVDQGFKEYRGRVVERFGEALDKELKYDIKAKEIEKVVTNEDGTETTVKETVGTAHVNQYSQYVRVFDETCKGWERNAEVNHARVNQVQNWANEVLRSRGYLYLNEVYSMLGFDKTEAGHVIGWFYDLDDPTCHNFVDFGVYDLDDERKRMFINGHEKSVILDFNVDGYIANKAY